ncbi:HNH endonuclease signature motif containing protein [Pectobacterium versatile]|uniref:HNH endonuclease n=1 Tax=Pectobacterium versatile TaxID=2488639 RepID=UPI003018A538
MNKKFDGLFRLPRYRHCKNAYLVYGKSRLDEQNRGLLAENKTGYWKIKSGRINKGDLIVLLLEVADKPKCYELFSGIMQDIERIRSKTTGVERSVITVDQFDKFTDINDQSIMSYLMGSSIPQGNNVNQIMLANYVSKVSEPDDFIDEVIEEHIKFQEQVIKAASDSTAARRKRLAKSAQRDPAFSIKKTKVYYRNPDVVAERLHLAKGICEECKEKAPFIRKSDGKPYLEVHHRISLSQGGADSVENTIAVCPNCHRQVHHGV